MSVAVETVPRAEGIREVILQSRSYLSLGEWFPKNKWVLAKVKGTPARCTQGVHVEPTSRLRPTVQGLVTVVSGTGGECKCGNLDRLSSVSFVSINMGLSCAAHLARRAAGHGRPVQLHGQNKFGRPGWKGTGVAACADICNRSSARTET